jgi:uncharacterized protein YbjT (DUF2867 family)
LARALLIGCGCSARGAGAVLLERGWSVRGSSRRAEGLEPIEAAGVEPVLADPDRVGTISELLGDVTVLAWLLGSAIGSSAELAALYGERLPSLLDALIDTPVRGFVYEATGTVPAGLLAAGRGRVEEIGGRSRIPVRILAADRADRDWPDYAADSIEGVLSD